MKIIVEMLHGLGDVVCCLPMLQAIIVQYPNAEVVVLVKFKSTREIVASSRLPIKKIINIDVYDDRLSETFAKIRYLRSLNADLGVSAACTPVRKAKVFMSLLNCKRVIGLQHEAGVNFDGLNDSMHFVDANLLAIKPILNEELYLCGNRDPKLFAGEKEIVKMRYALQKLDGRKIIGVCIGNADISYKNRWFRTGAVFTRGWGITNMRELVEVLIKAEYGVVLIGGAMETQLLDSIGNKILNAENVMNLVAQTSLKESIALASLCDLMIGVDTGMQHIADAVGTKTISIFGPTNPKTHGAYSNKANFVETECACKYCYGTHNYVGCEDRICLKNISVEMVYKKIQEVMR